MIYASHLVKWDAFFVPKPVELLEKGNIYFGFSTVPLKGL